MKELFLLSGLGADKRVFDFLDLDGYNIHHVLWIKPGANESLCGYAKRLLPQITRKKPILMGVSFGGMVALEIAKLIEVEKVILISSAKNCDALPTSFKIMGRLKLQKLMPPSAIKKPNEMLFWLFGVNTHEHRRLLASIMKDTDEIFFSWAIETICLWKNKQNVDRVIQIHGTNDRILNLRSADFVIEGGGHFMVVSRAKEISDIIKNVIGTA
jgi:pimeloyl-ACP methyl ester carboxylesterase